MSEREFWLTIRQGLLLVVDAIERKLEMNLRTADLRKVVKLQRKESQPEGSEEDG